MALCVSSGALDADELLALRGAGRSAAPSSLISIAQLGPSDDGDGNGDGSAFGGERTRAEAAGEQRAESARSEDGEDESDADGSDTGSNSESDEDEEDENEDEEEGDGGDVSYVDAGECGSASCGECRLLFFLGDDGRLRMAPLHVDRLRSLSRKCSNPNVRRTAGKQTAGSSNDFFADL